MPRYSEESYSSSFSVKKELREPLRDGLKKIGLSSYGELMTMIAEHGEEMALALAPVVEKFKSTNLMLSHGKGKARIAEQTIGDATPEELEQVKALLGSRSRVQ